MNHRQYNTHNSTKTRAWVILAACCLLAISFVVTTAILRAEAEAHTVTAWVICQPGDWVNATGMRNASGLGWKRTRAGSTAAILSLMNRHGAARTRWWSATDSCYAGSTSTGL